MHLELHHMQSFLRFGTDLLNTNAFMQLDLDAFFLMRFCGLKSGGFCDKKKKKTATCGHGLKKQTLKMRKAEVLLLFFQMKLS